MDWSPAGLRIRVQDDGAGAQALTPKDRAAVACSACENASPSSAVVSNAPDRRVRAWWVRRRGSGSWCPVLTDPVRTDPVPNNLTPTDRKTKEATREHASKDPRRHCR